MLRLTRAQVREIDRRAIEEYHIPGIVLMENASRGVADVAMEMLGNSRRASILIACGGGNNGGDGLATARHLCNRGHEVRILLAIDPQKFRGDAQINWIIAQAMKIQLVTTFERCDLVIDALYGTGLESAPRDLTIINRINESGGRVLAVDLPSGMNCDTGEAMEVCVRATRTVTFVAEKAGFGNPRSAELTGEITVADIGCPRELIEAVAKETQ